MYVILLSKLRFDQINYSGRSGTCWQFGVPKWYEIVKRLGTAGLAVYVHKSDLHLINGFCVGLVIVVKKFIMSSPGSLLVFCIT